MLCKGVQAISDIAVEYTNNKRKEVKCELICLSEQYLNNKESAKRGIDLANKYYSTTLESVRKALEKLRLHDIERMNSTIEACDQVIKQLTAWQSEIDQLYNGDQLVILIKNIENHLDHLTKNSNYMNRLQTSVKGYGYASEQNIPKTIGKLTETPFCIAKVLVKHAYESSECCIRSIALLEDCLILLTDGENKSIKLVSTIRNEVLSRFTGSFVPYRIALTEKKEAFVTQGAKSLLHFICPATDLNVVNILPTKDEYRTLEYYQHKILVQCSESMKTFELSGDGKCLRTLNEDISKTKNSRGKTFISHPVYSTLNRNTGAMILSCWGNNSLFEVAQNGSVNLILQSEKLNAPRGLEWVNDKVLLVCSSVAKRILVVDENREIKDFLKEEVPFEPYALRFDMDKNVLFIGGKSCQVLVYQMPFT